MQTEPFEMAQVIGAPPGFERVLASFSICAASEKDKPHWRHIEQVITVTSQMCSSLKSDSRWYPWTMPEPCP